jgi:hypothetical protein
MYSYEINEAENLVSVLVSGAVDLSSSRQLLAVATGDARFNPAFNFLVDVREMTATPSAGDLRQFADLLGQVKTLGRIGVVAAPGVQYGMGRMIATLAGLRDIRMDVFRDEVSARAWLRTTVGDDQ